MRDPREALFIAVYWFLGGYVLTWWTPAPFALVAGLVGVIIGLVLLLWVYAIEDQGHNAPPLLGLMLFGLPLTMILVGAIGWTMIALGLL